MKIATLSLPRERPVACGQSIELWFPQHADYEFAYQLRAQPSVYTQLRDDTLWSREKMFREMERLAINPADTLLIIRPTGVSQPIGFIGWDGLDQKYHAIAVGRLAIHLPVLRELTRSGLKLQISPAFDALSTAVDFLFAVGEPCVVRAYARSQNRASIQLIKKVGLKDGPQPESEPLEGVKYFQMSRAAWSRRKRECAMGRMKDGPNPNLSEQ